MRFVGDAVAIVAGETEAAVDLALKRIKVKYKVETPVLDIHQAKDNAILVHPEDDWKLKIPLGGDNKRNLCALAVEEEGNVDEVLAECKYTVEQTYHTKANQQTMMETFRTACYMDHFGRLTVLSSTQIPVPCAQDRGQGTGYSGIEGACDQAQDRRRLWSKADLHQ